MCIPPTHLQWMINDMQISEVSHTVLLFKLKQIKLSLKKFKFSLSYSVKLPQNIVLFCFFFPLEIRRPFLWVQHDVTYYFCEPWAFSVQQFPFNHGCAASSGPAAAGKAWRADTEVLGASCSATLQPALPSPGHREGTSHQFRALGCTLEGMGTR